MTVACPPDLRQFARNLDLLCPDKQSKFVLRLWTEQEMPYNLCRPDI